jgi:hypothetical protein
MVNLKNYALAMFIAPNGDLDGVWEYNLPEEKEVLASDFQWSIDNGWQCIVYENPQPTRETRAKKVEGYFVDAFGVTRSSANPDEIL